MFTLFKVMSRLTKFGNPYTATLFNVPYNFTFLPVYVTKSRLSLSLHHPVFRLLGSFAVCTASHCMRGLLRQKAECRISVTLLCFFTSFTLSEWKT
jgi:hypothetical protein